MMAKELHIHIHTETADSGVVGMKKGVRKSELGMTAQQHAAKMQHHLQQSRQPGLNPQQINHHHGQAQMHEYYSKNT